MGTQPRALSGLHGCGELDIISHELQPLGTFPSPPEPKLPLESDIFVCFYSTQVDFSPQGTK